MQARTSILVGCAAAAVLGASTLSFGASIALTNAGYTQNFSTFATDNAGAPVDTGVNTGGSFPLVLPSGFTIGGGVPALAYGADIASATGSDEYYRGVYAVGGPGGPLKTNGTTATPPTPYQTDQEHAGVYAATTYIAGASGTTAGAGSYSVADRGSGTHNTQLNFSVTNSTGGTLTGLSINYQVLQYSGSTAPTTVELFSDNGTGVAGNTGSSDTLPAGYTQTNITGTVSQSAGAHFTTGGSNATNVTEDATNSVLDSANVEEPYGATTALGYTNPSSAGPEVASVSATYTGAILAGQTVNFTLDYVDSSSSGNRGFVGVSNIAINPLSVATPEPASLGLLGLASVGVLRRNRRRRA